MMAPLVTLQVTALPAESAALVKPTAVKAVAAFSRRVSVLGEMTSWAMVPPPVASKGRGFSHPTTAAAASTARENATRRSFSRASRLDSLCLNVMGCTPSLGFASRREELTHIGSGRCRAREVVDAEALEDEPQGARVLVRGRRLVATLRLGADRRAENAAAAERVVAAGFVEHDDPQAFVLEHRTRDQRRDVRLQPAV